MAQEKNFENRLKDWLKSIGVYPANYPMNKMTVPQIGWYFKMWGGGMSSSGIPDIILCIQGAFVAIEVKSQTGKESELQKLNIYRIRGSAGNGCFLYPSGFDAFKRDLLRMIHAIRFDGSIYQLNDRYK